MTMHNLVELLSSPPFGLAYHGVVLVAVILLTGVTRSFATRYQSPRAARWYLAASWIFILRAILATAALLAPLALVQRVALVPSLGPFISLAGIILFGWAILFPKSHQVGDRLLLVVLVVALVGLAANLISEQLAAVLTRSPVVALDIGWTLMGFLLSLAIAALLAIRRPARWITGGTGFLFLAGGFGLQLISGIPLDPVSGLVRPAEMIAYPLILLAAVFSMLDELPSYERAARPAQPSGLTPHEGDEQDRNLGLLGLLSAPDPDALGQTAVKATSEALRAEYCLLLSAPDDRDQFAVAIGYDLIRERFVSGASLDATSAPIFTTALSKRSSLTLSIRSHAPDVTSLQAILGLPSTGPVLFVPITYGDRLYGGFVVLSPFARRTWSDSQRVSLERIAGAMGMRLHEMMMGKTSDSGSGEAYQELAEAQNRIKALETENMRMFEALHTSGGPSPDDTDDLFETRMRLEQAEETVKILEAEIERLKAAYTPPAEAPTSAEIDHLTGELQSALQDLVDARAEISRLKTEGPMSVSRGGDTIIDPEAIASIAQELRQPMSSILGYTELLLGESVGLLGAMQRKFLERVRTGIERMGNLLNDLIQITALESGTLNLTPTQVDLLGCVEEAVTQAGPGLRERDLTLRMDFPDSVPAVMGDEEAIAQIILHLLNNAMVASPEGGEVVLSARVEQSEEAGFLMVSVSDHGEGIPPEDLGRVFQRLYQGDRVIIQGVGDGGIGLSLVKALSEAHGGRVWVESEVGGGSTFTVLLPLAEVSSQESFEAQLGNLDRDQAPSPE